LWLATPVDACHHTTMAAKKRGRRLVTALLDRDQFDQIERFRALSAAAPPRSVIIRAAIALGLPAVIGGNHPVSAEVRA
jgi:hypothetical protein